MSLLGALRRKVGWDAAPRPFPGRDPDGVWREDAAALPRFEQPDALARVPEVAARRGLGAQGEAWLAQWVTEGYFVVEDLYPADLIDRFVACSEGLWTRAAPIPGLNISGVVLDGVYRVHVPHAELLALPPAARQAAQAASDWRVTGFHGADPAAAALFRWANAAKICSAIFDRPAVPRTSLTFAKGSQQSLHQDTAVFHVWPRNFMAGLWIACEDVAPGAGPLEFYPGSHREPLFPEFDNYPQTQRRTASPAQIARYDEYVRGIATRYERKVFLGRKGAGLFWHGMLIHGGAPVTDSASTRKSFVLHYMPDGADRAGEVHGPFNW